ncbi:MAG: hypothetical protein ACXWJC_06765 [Croceibacterium sp.]
MILDEQQLGVILQASIDRAAEMLEQAGGFLPFGARARLDGEVEFLEASGDGGEPLDALYRRIGGLLAEDASRDDILASALVANTSLPAGVDIGFETALVVQVEALEFCRAVVVPYRIVSGRVEFGEMIPEEADPIVFAA